MSSPSIELKITKPFVNEEGKLLLTYDQIKILPEFPQTRVIELLNGEIFMPPSPSVQHQRIVKKLLIQLEKYVSSNNLGEVFVAPIDVCLDSLNVVVPDIIFIFKEKADLVGQRCINGSPDLVIEVASANITYDLERKRRIYEKFKVQEYWVIIPQNKKIHLFILDGNRDKFLEKIFEKPDEIIKSQILSGFALRVQDIFQM